MSIINDALKKAQKEKESFIPLAVEANVGLQVHKKHGFNWGPIFVLLVLFLITGPIIAPFFAAPFKREAAAGASLPKTISVGQKLLQDPALLQKNQVGALPGAVRKGQFGIEESSLLPTPGPIGATLIGAFQTNFNLSGIVYSPKESYCIINDKIVKVGEQVSGATLLEITPEKVMLDYKGQTISLV